MVWPQMEDERPFGSAWSTGNAAVQEAADLAAECIDAGDVVVSDDDVCEGAIFERVAKFRRTRVKKDSDGVPFVTGEWWVPGWHVQLCARAGDYVKTHGRGRNARVSMPAWLQEMIKHLYADDHAAAVIAGTIAVLPDEVYGREFMQAIGDAWNGVRGPGQ